jgi:hypothetical protein
MKSSVKVICSKFCHKLNEINHQRYFKSKHFSSMNLACLMLFAFSLMVCASGVDEKQSNDNFLNSIHTKTLDNRSAADVINEGKNLVFEIVRLLLRN